MSQIDAVTGRLHYWIIEINDDPKRRAWRGYRTCRGRLDMRAYHSRKEAEPDLVEARNIYGRVRL